MCSELTPRARIPDTRIQQLMQPCLNGDQFWNVVLVFVISTHSFSQDCCCPFTRLVDQKKFLLVLCQVKQIRKSSYLSSASPQAPKTNSNSENSENSELSQARHFEVQPLDLKENVGNELQTRPSIVKISKSRPLIWNCKSLCSECCWWNLYQRHYHRIYWKCWKCSEQLTTEVWNVTLRRCALSTKEELQSSYALLSLCTLWTGNRGFWIFCSCSLLCTYLVYGSTK